MIAASALKYKALGVIVKNNEEEGFEKHFFLKIRTGLKRCWCYECANNDTFYD